ncbi:hypothetical protein ACIHFD_49775 [Nonomuraea sp. NPDC051941]|uniref:hypothetical protein n=1 Tax=Nonomuraea sp. NPDC051941 TaxID=3364373 RepID=UPI0037C55F39
MQVWILEYGNSDVHFRAGVYLAPEGETTPPENAQKAFDAKVAEEFDRLGMKAAITTTEEGRLIVAGDANADRDTYVMLALEPVQTGD